MLLKVENTKTNKIINFPGVGGDQGTFPKGFLVRGGVSVCITVGSEDKSKKLAWQIGCAYLVI